MISNPRPLLWGLVLASLLSVGGAPIRTTFAEDGPIGGPGATPGSRILDKGSFAISVRGRAVGRETFAVDAGGDSLVLRSTSIFTRHVNGVDQETKKLLNMAVSSDNFTLRSYLSNERVSGHERVRGIVLAADTVFTLYDEIDGHGDATAYAMPPGRVYVLEAQLYTLMYLIAYSLHSQPFDTRPINIVTLANRDTVAEAIISKLPAETIRWGSKPVVANHLQFRQAPLEFDLWVDRQGHLLLMTHAGTGLRVEREAPKVKSRARSPRADEESKDPPESN